MAFGIFVPFGFNDLPYIMTDWDGFGGLSENILNYFSNEKGQGPKPPPPKHHAN